MADDNLARQHRNNTFVIQVTHFTNTLQMCMLQRCVCSYWQSPHTEELMLSPAVWWWTRVVWCDGIFTCMCGGERRQGSKRCLLTSFPKCKYFFLFSDNRNDFWHFLGILCIQFGDVLAQNAHLWAEYEASATQSKIIPLPPNLTNWHILSYLFKLNKNQRLNTAISDLLRQPAHWATEDKRAYFQNV